MRTRTAWFTGALAAAAIGATAAFVLTEGAVPGGGLVPTARRSLVPTPTPIGSVTPDETSPSPEPDPSALPLVPTTDQELARLLPGVTVDRGTAVITAAGRRPGQPAPLRLAAGATAVPPDTSGRGRYIVMVGAAAPGGVLPGAAMPGAVPGGVPPGAVPGATAPPPPVPSEQRSARSSVQSSPPSSVRPLPSLPSSWPAATGPASPEAAAERARVAGAQVTGRFADGYVARFTPAQLAAARLDPATGWVEIDAVVTATTVQTDPPWGVDRIDQRYPPVNHGYDYALTGAGVRAFVIDTGLRSSHAELRGRTAAGADFVKDGGGTTDCNGHGTHVAGTIGGIRYGVAKGVTIVPVRVLDCRGYGTNSGVIAGIDWVTAHRTGPSVANLSLGGDPSSAIDAAVRRSIAAGVTYVIAAGNELVNPCSGTTAESPARVTEAIVVGATQELDSRDTRYSNFGPCVDVFAPGTNITSAWFSGDTATAVLSGTSMATPHVAGAVAQYLQANPTASPATVQAVLVQRATAGVVRDRGARSPDKFLFVPLAPPSVTVTGNLSGLGARAVLPRTGAFTTQVPGDVTGVLTGPAGTDFDLYLSRWTGADFAVVARAETDGSNETIRYTGAPGTYYWTVISSAGSGSFSLTTTEP